LFLIQSSISDGTSSYIRLTKLPDSAGFRFNFSSGRYDINAHYLSESSEQNTCTLYIADNRIVAWLGKNRDDQWHTLGEQKWHILKNIKINKGEKMQHHENAIVIIGNASTGELSNEMGAKIYQISVMLD
jgi:hypothetical protein